MPTRATVLRSTLGACAAGALFAGERTIVAAQSPVVVKFGTGNVEANAQGFYALDQGFFKKNGIDAEVTILRSGSVTMQSIISGQLHVGVGNTVSLALALLRNIPFMLIAPGALWDARAPYGALIIATANSPIKTPKDLAGQTLGVTSLNSVDQVAYETYLDQNGVDRSTVKYVELVPSAMAEAVATGRVAVGIQNDPELGTALASGRVKRLASAYDSISKLFLITGWMTTRDWLEKNKETAKRFADAIIAAGEWGESHRPQAMDILEKYTKFRSDKSVALFGRKLDPALVQAVWDPAAKYKIISGPLKATDYCWDGK
jgi:NitT/TauT family transport system substrate-binding protein